MRRGPSQLPQVATCLRRKAGREPGGLGTLHSALCPQERRGGRPGARPAGTVRTTWSVCGAEVEDEAASRLLGGLAVPQGEVVHAEHAGLVFRGQELPAGRKVWFLPSPLGTGHRAGPRERSPPWTPHWRGPRQCPQEFLSLPGSDAVASEDTLATGRGMRPAF